MSNILIDDRDIIDNNLCTWCIGNGCPMCGGTGEHDHGGDDDWDFDTTGKSETEVKLCRFFKRTDIQYISNNEFGDTYTNGDDEIFVNHDSNLVFVNGICAGELL